MLSVNEGGYYQAIFTKQSTSIRVRTKRFFSRSLVGEGGGGEGGRTEDPARIREAHFARWVASRRTGFSSRWASPISSLST